MICGPELDVADEEVVTVCGVPVVVGPGTTGVTGWVELVIGVDTLFLPVEERNPETVADVTPEEVPDSVTDPGIVDRDELEPAALECRYGRGRVTKRQRRVGPGRRHRIVHLEGVRRRGSVDVSDDDLLGPDQGIGRDADCRNPTGESGRRNDIRNAEAAR
ncbi:hypothetical protein PG990_004045 [Apiospora arundinis]